MAKAAVRNSDLSLEEANEFLTYALLGTGQVLVERGLTFAETVDRVATKGELQEKVLRSFNSRHLRCLMIYLHKP